MTNKSDLPSDPRRRDQRYFHNEHPNPTNNSSDNIIIGGNDLASDSHRDSRNHRQHKDRTNHHRNSDEDRNKKKSSNSKKESREKDRLPTLEELGYKSKKYKFFDIPANGFENIQPQQYLLMVESGQLPRLIYVPASSLSVNTEVPWGGCFVNTQAKRLYVGNIPLSTTESELVEFFNVMMKEHSLTAQDPGPCILSTQINLEKNFAFIEFRSVEETSSALILDGVEFQGCALKLRRPRDYQPIQTWSVSGEYSSLPANFQLRAFGAGTGPAKSSNKLFITNLPPSYGDSELRNLLSIYGPVGDCCEIVKDGTESVEKGYAVAEYTDPSVVQDAIKSLDGMKIDGHTISVQSGSQMLSANLSGGGLHAGINPNSVTMPGLANVQVPGVKLGVSHQEETVTEILCLMNMIGVEDLLDDDEYYDIMDDIKVECEKFGVVKSVEIPRPKESGEEVPGLGKAFVEFTSKADCKIAAENLSGRKFADKIVVTSFITPAKFYSRKF